MGAAIKQRVSARQMPPWHIDRSIGEYLDDPSLSDKEIETIVELDRRRRAAGQSSRRAAAAEVHGGRRVGRSASRTSSCAWRKGSPFPRAARISRPSEVVDPGITEDRYVKWVQIIPDAHCCVHHSHVYVATPEGADTEGLGLGMGSNTDNEVDLIEYAAGNDADLFAEGTAKMIKAGSKFRFSPHYHPYGEEVTIGSASASSSIRKATSRSTSSPPIGSGPTSAISGR